MGRVIVIQFVSLDGVIEDPDGSQGFDRGGWAFRYGPQAVAGDKFKLGALLDTATLLVGGSTWRQFSRIWPTRSDEFSAKMNAIPKLVASRSLERVDEWNNSAVIRGDLIDAVCSRKVQHDMIVVGSTSVVRQLMEHDLVDEYRLLIFPLVIGQGCRLFENGMPGIDLSLVSIEQQGPTVLVRYDRVRAPRAAAAESAAPARSA